MFMQPSFLHSTFFQPHIVLMTVSDDDATERTTKCSGSSKLSKVQKSIVYRRLRSDATELDSSYHVVADVPGVKLSDITVEITDGQVLQVKAERTLDATKKVVAKYEQKYGLNKRKLNISDASAQLENGVLTIQIPKKPKTEPVVVTVTTQDDATSNSKEKKDLNVLLTLDIPGVKVGDLKVELYDGKIHLNMKRERGNAVLKTAKQFGYEEDKVDLETLKGFLVNGVLTLLADKVDELEHSKAPTVVKIDVQEVLHDETMKDKLHSNDDALSSTVDSNNETVKM